MSLLQARHPGKPATLQKTLGKMGLGPEVHLESHFLQRLVPFRLLQIARQRRAELGSRMTETPTVFKVGGW